MNKKILNTSLESLMFFDAEFVAQNEELDTSSKEFELFQYKNRDKVNDELLEDDKVVELYKTKAALNPIYNKIICCSVAFVKNNVCYYKAITGTEKEITEQFYSILSRGNYTLVSHNGIAFDLPSIRIAALRSGCEVELNDKYNESGKKIWNITDNHIDLMEVFRGTYYYSFNLDEICYLMGIESPKEGEVKGKGLSEYYYKNGLRKIPQYCNKDTVALVQIVAKLKGELDNLVYEDKTEEVLEVREISVLEKIYYENEISKQSKKELLELLGKKRLLKGHKEILIDMLYNLSTNARMFESDSDKVKKEKLKVVEELINSL